jgi:hemerythrin-like domain-containing protein
MLHGIGRGPKVTQAEDPATLLASCHAKIRELVRIAAVLADEREIPEDEVREAARRLRRYFTLALPLHEADEEKTLAPRLRALDASLAAELDAIEREHAALDALLAELLPHWRTLEETPAKRGALLGVLAAGRPLAEMFETHLEVEELLLFPRITELATDARAEMAVEITARRKGAFFGD